MTVLIIALVLCLGAIFFLYLKWKGEEGDNSKLKKALDIMTDQLKKCLDNVPCRNPSVLKAKNYFKMATNHIIVPFTLCSPAPSGGYIIKYKPLGDPGAYRDAPGNPYASSPAVWDDILDPAGTAYEGFIQSDCGDGNLGLEVPFETTVIVPPVPCEGVCGRYQAVGEAPLGVPFTWVDCDGIENATVIPFSEAFFFCTCDDDPQYSDTDVTVSRVNDCDECRNYQNQTAGSLTVTFTQCNNNVVEDFIVGPGQTICAVPGTLSGPDAGSMTDLGTPCS